MSIQVSINQTPGITHRCDLVHLVQEGAVCAELGVAAGDFSATLLEQGPWIARLFSIDRWSDHHDQAEYLAASSRLAAFGGRSVVVRMTFAQACGLFEDGSFDLVYVDGYAHTGQEGGATLRDWWPKVKPGGILAGHDYDVAYAPTIEAVNAFAAEHGLDVHVVAGPCDRYASWWVRKGAV